MQTDSAGSESHDAATLHVERLPVAVGTLLGTSIVAVVLIAVAGLGVKDEWLTNALYGFCVGIPTVLLAYIWSSVDRGAQRAPGLIFALGAWATIFGMSCTIEHFDAGAGAFFYVLSSLCMAMLVFVVPGAARAQAAASRH